MFSDIIYRECFRANGLIITVLLEDEVKAVSFGEFFFFSKLHVNVAVG